MGRWPVPLLAVTGAVVAAAHDPITTKLTWSREISRIVYTRCAGCHHEGGSAPMPLVTYQQVRPWAKSIKEQVLNRQMPPWGAVKGFGDFRNDRGLSQEEIGLIAAWVEGGAPEGDPALLPLLPPAASGQPLTPAHTLVVPAGIVLKHSLSLLGIEPLAPKRIRSARIQAVRPDGSIEPLLWLRDYRADWKMRYEYRQPLELPRGARIVSDSAVTLRLLYN